MDLFYLQKVLMINIFEGWKCLLTGGGLTLPSFAGAMYCATSIPTEGGDDFCGRAFAAQLMASKRKTEGNFTDMLDIGDGGVQR